MGVFRTKRKRQKATKVPRRPTHKHNTPLTHGTHTQRSAAPPLAARRAPARRRRQAALDRVLNIEQRG